ncbi:MAG TPA: hypothetical protein VK922_12120 [Gemmatimonadaceae bacterium]|nr:hypothetical protein [Gemmatimonadaceae bacterium]
MSTPTAFPFVLKRGDDKIDGLEITSTTETIHGLLRVDGERLTLQWRRSRSTDVVGFEIRTDKELEPVREVSMPISALAGAAVRWRWLRWPPGRYLVLTAADLQAFEAIGGEAGLRLDHPAELEIRVRRREHSAAQEFAAELNLSVAERALTAAENRVRLPESR